MVELEGGTEGREFNHWEAALFGSANITYPKIRGRDHHANVGVRMRGFTARPHREREKPRDPNKYKTGNHCAYTRAKGRTRVLPRHLRPKKMPLYAASLRVFGEKRRTTWKRNAEATFPKSFHQSDHRLLCYPLQSLSLIFSSILGCSVPSRLVASECTT